MAAAPAHPLAAVARQWLSEMQVCVRTQDYARARQLCAPDVVLFSVRTTFAVGPEAAEREQWRRAWPNIRDFTFRLDEMYCFGGDQGLCVAVQGDMQMVQPDGTTTPASNRATIMLQPHGGDRWLAAHLHFSQPPAPPAAPSARRT